MDDFKSEIQKIEAEILLSPTPISLQVNRHIPKLDSLVRYSLFKDKKN